MSNANKIARVNEPIRTLRKIQTIRPEAIIAGGYHRDIYNDVNYSDVDIYVQNVTDENRFDPFNHSDWEQLLGLKTNNFRSMDMIQELGEGDDDYDTANTENLCCVFAMIKNEIQYNIMVVNNNPVEFVLEDFDFDICKTYCDGKKVTFTKEFMSDSEFKTLTYTSNSVEERQLRHAIQIHLPKLQQKYPNHKVVIPNVHANTVKGFTC